MNLFGLSSICVCSINLIIAVFFFMRRDIKTYYFLFSLSCFFVAVWGLGGYFISAAKTKEAAYLAWQFGSIGVVLSPILFLHFVMHLFEPKAWRYTMQVVYVIALFFLALIFFNPVYYFGNLRFIFEQFWFLDWLEGGSIFYLLFYVIHYFVYVFYILYQMVSAYGIAEGKKQRQLLLLLIGFLIGWLGGAGLFFPVFKIDIYPYSNFLIAVMPIFMCFALLGYEEVKG